jgi:CRP-like cAMP-binding protein
MALLDQTARTATVRCLEPMNVLRILRDEFDTLSASFPEVRQRLERLMAERRSHAAAAVAPPPQSPALSELRAS